MQIDNVTNEILHINHHHNHDAPQETSATYDVTGDSVWVDFVSKRETRCLRIDNFVYYKKAEKEGMISWHCTHRGCQASAESDNELQNKRLKNKTHNHNPKSDEFFLSSRINHGIKRRLSQDPTERTQKAVDVII